MEKIILVYYGGLKNHIIFNHLLNEFPEKIDCVINTSISPRKKGRINFKAYSNLFKSDLKFISFIFLITYFSNFIMYFFNNIKRTCKLKKIKFIKSNKFNYEFIKESNLNKNATIFYSGVEIVEENVINYFGNNIIGFHEAELPYMRGSALYFWYFLIPDFKYACCSLQKIGRGIDTGKAIKFTDKIEIKECKSVVELWLKLLQSYRHTITDLIDELEKDNNTLYKFENNITEKAKIYLKTFPKNEQVKNLKKNGIPLIKIEDLKQLFNEIN